MWGSFLDKGREFAEKAAQAAAELDKTLNDSVGATTTTASTSESTTTTIIPSSLTASLFGTRTDSTKKDNDDDDDYEEDVLNDDDDDWGDDNDNIQFDPSTDDQNDDTIIPETQTSLDDHKQDTTETEDKLESDYTNDKESLEIVDNKDLPQTDDDDDNAINDTSVPVQVEELGETSIPDNINADKVVLNDSKVIETMVEEVQDVAIESSSEQDTQSNNQIQDTTAVDTKLHLTSEIQQTTSNDTESVSKIDSSDSNGIIDKIVPVDEEAVVTPELDETPSFEREQVDPDASAVETSKDENHSILVGIEPESTEDIGIVTERLDTLSSNERNILDTSIHGKPEENTTDTNSYDHEKDNQDLDNHVTESILSDNLAEYPIQQSDSTRAMEIHIEELMKQLQQREMQLVQKSEELVEIQSNFEKERSDLQLKLQSTKDEAKRRISKAKERVDVVERQMQSITAAQSGTSETIAQKDEIIAALRSEGEKLAHKQAEMEKATRTAKAEAREIRVELEEAHRDKEDAIARIEELSIELADTKEALTSARQGESQADKLESELRQVKDECERRQATIISMEQQTKDLKGQIKDLQQELESSRKGAAVESEQERKKLLKEQSELAKDLENTIRVTEREAALREDALRHEIEELRKRWQDAVRRADTLAIDIQTSTAPLLRQLDSVSKQNRTRASAWAELETQLRSELEDNVVANEKLSKERNEWKSKFTRTERLFIDQEETLKVTKAALEEKSKRVTVLENQMAKMDTESAALKEQWAEVEKIANEGVSKVRTDMMKTVVENEERYRSQLEMVKSELDKERANRKNLEQQVAALLVSAQVLIPTETPTPSLLLVEEVKPKKLRQTEGQASILASTLGGLVDESDDDDNDDEEADENSNTLSSNIGSFAALDQLTSSLKATKNELLVLRNRLAQSEKSREELLDALAECRSAKEKLPLFESRVKELTEENNELLQQVNGLREDIAEVKELYRAQLNVLLEEKVTWEVNGSGPSPIENDHPTNGVDLVELQENGVM